MECWSPTLLEHGALEAFDHGVVVRRQRRDLHSGDVVRGERFSERGGLVLVSVLRNDRFDWEAHLVPGRPDPLEETDRDRPAGIVF
jgi:hypothetical protein